MWLPKQVFQEGRTACHSSANIPFHVMVRFSPGNKSPRGFVSTLVLWAWELRESTAKRSYSHGAGPMDRNTFTKVMNAIFCSLLVHSLAAFPWQHMLTLPLANWSCFSNLNFWHYPTQSNARLCHLSLKVGASYLKVQALQLLSESPFPRDQSLLGAPLVPM